MGSNSVTCHQTQVNTPHLNPSQTGRYSIYLHPKAQKAVLTKVVGYTLRWFTCQQTVTHPSSNRAQCRATFNSDIKSVPDPKSVCRWV